MAKGSYNSRKFNLIPPKTKQEVMVLQERDNSILYSFLLVFFGMIVFFVMTMAQSLVVDPRLAGVKANLESKKNEVATFDSVRKINGELFTKSRALEDILAEDIKLTQLLEISQLLIKDVSNANILAYSRQTEGEFLIDLELRQFNDINNIVSNADEITVLENLYIKSLNKTTNGIVTASISFKIKNLTTNA